jgi:hypothetical protein
VGEALVDCFDAPFDEIAFDIDGDDVVDVGVGEAAALGVNVAEDQDVVRVGHAAAHVPLGQGPEAACGDDAVNLGKPFLQSEDFGLVLQVGRGGLVHGYLGWETLSPSFSMSKRNCASCSAKKRANSARFM